MKLGYVIVYVADVAATIRFYEKAFDLRQKFLLESGEYGEMETGTTTLAFALETFVPTKGVFLPNRPNNSSAGAEIGLVTDEVENAFAAAVREGATPVIEPLQKPWGQTVAYVKDNNGFLVEICSPVAAT